MDLVSLYQREGYGLKKLSRLFGFTPNAVKKRLRKAGVYKGWARSGGNPYYLLCLI